MKRNLIVVFGMLVLGWSAPAQTQPTPKPKRVVTAAQVNGLYRVYKNEFRILALGKNRLKVQFDGIYPTPKSFNMGYAAGEAIIDGNVATFKPDERCEITLIFLPNQLKVVQAGADFECGFGHNVNATGTYRKIRGGKPKFEPPD